MKCWTEFTELRGIIKLERVVLNGLASAAVSRQTFVTSFSSQPHKRRTAPSAILFGIAFRRGRSTLVAAGMALTRTIGHNPNDHPAFRFVTRREMPRSS